MTYWRVREELSQAHRLRRSYYNLLRDQLDQFLLQYSLIESFDKFFQHKQDYPFVEKRELKPRARIPDTEYSLQNSFLLVFVEDTIPARHKKYIRFFDVNRTTKSNLLHSQSFSLQEPFDRGQKFLESIRFFDFVRILLPIDYALLVQRDAASHIRDRYNLSHFRVRIDWPIADAAEDMARNLRYISKDLYEKGDKYAEDLQKKFFEYYGLPMMSGGRRTAAIVAAQYLRRIPCISTVYVSSSESRSLIRISERGVSKTVLMRFSAPEINDIAASHQLSVRTFKKNYVVARRDRPLICLFQVTYSHTNQARKPEDGKLRELKPDLSWLSVDHEHLVPLPGIWKYPPLPLNLIYT